MSFLPPPARAIATGLDDAVDAVRRGDAEAYADAVARLTAEDPEQVGLVLGAVVRSLLEAAYPDGLAGDDVREALEDCLRDGAALGVAIDPDVLLVVVTGALGIFDPDLAPRVVRPAELAAHAPLLVADLLGRTRRPLRHHVELAFAEIRRAETMELP